MMLFNSTGMYAQGMKGIISFDEMKTETGIEDAELKRTLQSLCLGRQKDSRVLLKKPKSSIIEEKSWYKINSDYKSKFFRVKINTVQIKETVKKIKKKHYEV